MEEKQSIRELILNTIKDSKRGLDSLEITKKALNTNRPTIQDIRMVQDEVRELQKKSIIRETHHGNFVINELISGTVDLHERGNAHIIIKDGEDIFIPKASVKGARDKDTVLVEYTDKNKNEGRIVSIVSRGLGKSIAEVKNIEGQLVIEPIDKNLDFQIEIEKSNMNLVEGMLVHLEYVKDITKDRVLARIDKVMGHKNALLNPGQEPTEISGMIATKACEYDLRLLFPPEVLEEAKNMPKELSQSMIYEGLENGRVDFRNDIIFTIDGKDTKDIDDAIGIKILPNGNYELAVHIADVSHYVKPGSEIWKEAELRGNSNYLGNKVIPMLPVELSNGICSLNEGVDRFTTSCIMEINHAGEIVDYKVCKGIINSRKKMNYDAVQDILEDKETDDTKDYTTLDYTVGENDTKESIAFTNNMTVDELESLNKDCKFKVGDSVKIPVSKVLKNMQVLSKIMDAQKQRAGELRFDSDEVKIHQDEETDEVLEIKPRVQRDAERLIENFMIAANISVGKFLTENLMPTYRIHDKPSPKKIEDFLKFLDLIGHPYTGKINIEDISNKDCQAILEHIQGLDTEKVLNKKFLRCQQKAAYSTENIGHFALALLVYTHFTSPIRRMDDLINHTSIGYILNAKLENRPIDSKFLKEWNSHLKYISEKNSENEINSEKCEYAVDDMLKSWFMIKEVGEEFEGYVDSIFANSFFVQTDNYIDGRVGTIEVGENEYPVGGYYQYNENLMGYTRNNKVILRYGDRVLVECVGANPEEGQVDFKLIRKL